jgi:hypothetical protein
LFDHKWYAALAYIRANRLNHNVIEGPADRLGIILNVELPGCSGNEPNDRPKGVGRACVCTQGTHPQLVRARRALG